MSKKFDRKKRDLMIYLDEELNFLVHSSMLYDEGFLFEAKRLAVTVRVLCHDSKGSYSLLGQLHKKDITVVDTSWQFVPENLLSHLGLVGIGITDDFADYIPLLDDNPNKREKSFKEWWNRDPILRLRDGRSYTRQDIVKNLANKEGGAHVDPDIQRAFEEIRRLCAKEWGIRSTSSKLSFQTPYDFVAMRQIAHELLSSLKREFPGYPTDLQIPPHLYNIKLGGASIVGPKITGN